AGPWRLRNPRRGGPARRLASPFLRRGGGRASFGDMPALRAPAAGGGDNQVRGRKSAAAGRREHPMKIKVKQSLCDGFGTCAVHAPELFELDEWGYATEAGDGTVPAGSEEKA